MTRAHMVVAVMSSSHVSTPPTNMTFAQFWEWGEQHQNCIVRAGTPDAALFDDEDVHWAFGVEEGDTHVVQMMRAKRIVAEVIMHAADIAYVEYEAGEENEYVFQLVGKDDEGVRFQFAFRHPYGQADAEHTVSWN